MDTQQLIEQFENCTLPKAAWSHERHFIMALWYCTKYPIPQAIDKIRNGIIKYNESVGGQNTDTSGYHETMTLFYTSVIANYLLINGTTDELLQQPFIAKDFIFQYYSEALIMSKEARLKWVQPDKAGVAGLVVTLV